MGCVYTPTGQHTNTCDQVQPHLNSELSGRELLPSEKTARRYSLLSVSSAPSTPSMPKVPFPSTFPHHSELSSTPPLLQLSSCAIPMAALRESLQSTMVDRRAPSLEEHTESSPSIHTCNTDQSRVSHFSITWGAALVVRLPYRMRPYRKVG